MSLAQREEGDPYIRLMVTLEICQSISDEAG